MFEECSGFFAGERASEPLHVVFHKHLHGRAPNGARAFNRHVDATSNRHVRPEKNWTSWRIGEPGFSKAMADKPANWRRRRFSVSAILSFISIHFTIGPSKQLGATPASSNSLYPRIRRVCTSA